MPFIIQGKTNFVYLSIVLIVALLAGAGVFLYGNFIDKQGQTIIQQNSYSGQPQTEAGQDENLPSEFIIKSVDLGSTKSDENGVVSGTVSNLSAASPGMHTIEIQGTGKDGNPLTRRRFFNVPGKPRAGTVYAVYFNIFNPKNNNDDPEIIDVTYGGKDYAILSPDENGGVFVQFQISDNQDKFEAAAKSRDTGKSMEVSVDVDKASAAKDDQVPVFEKTQAASGTGYRDYFVVVNDDQAGNMPIGVFPGEQIHIQLGPFKANSRVHSEPSYYNIGSFTSDENGIVDEVIKMPDLGPGVHEIMFEGDCPANVMIGLAFKVVYPGNPIDGYGFYLTGFTPYDEDIDYDEQGVEIRLGNDKVAFFEKHPDEDGGIFIQLPAIVGKLEFTAEEKLTGKTVKVSMDISDEEAVKK